MIDYSDPICGPATGAGWTGTGYGVKLFVKRSIIVAFRGGITGRAGYVDGRFHDIPLTGV